MTDLATAPYRIDFSSYNAFLLTWLNRTFFTRRNLTRFLLFTGLIAAVSFWQTRGFTSPFGMTILAALTLVGSLITAAILVYIVAPGLVWLWQVVIYALDRQRPIQSLSLKDNGVVKIMDENSHVYVWDEILNVFETKGAIFLFTGRNSAMIVPKNAFASPAHAKTFAETVTERTLRRPHPDPAKNF